MRQLLIIIIAATLLGIRNWGHGIIVFDIDDYHFVKRIPTDGLTDASKPLNVRGICGNTATDCLYVSTIGT